MIIYEIIDMSKWETKEDLLFDLFVKDISLNERDFRKEVEENNKLFAEHQRDKFIAHSQNGYIATTDNEIIKRSIEDNKKRALDLLTKYSKTMKAIGENCNVNMQISNDSLIIVEA